MAETKAANLFERHGPRVGKSGGGHIVGRGGGERVEDGIASTLTGQKALQDGAHVTQAVRPVELCRSAGEHQEHDRGRACRRTDNDCMTPARTCPPFACL